MNRPAASAGSGGARRDEQRRQRRQWCAVGIAALLVALRLLLEGSPTSTPRVLGGLALAFSLASIITSFRDSSYDMDQAYAARDALKTLPPADRRTLRRAIARGEAVRPDLLGVAEVTTRVRGTQTRPLGWLGAGLSTTQLYRELPWAIALPVPALVMAIIVVWLRGRWVQQHSAVLDQLNAEPA